MWRWLGRFRRPARFTLFNRASVPLRLWLEPWAEEVVVPLGSRADLVLTGAFSRSADAPFEFTGEQLIFYAPGGSSLIILIDGEEQYRSYAVVPYSRKLGTRDFVHLVFDGFPEARAGRVPAGRGAEALSLGSSMDDGETAIIPLAEAHRSQLRQACAEDSDIWPIYSASYDPDHFDQSFDTLVARPDAQAFAILSEGELVGMSAYLGIEPQRGVLEIGNTYYVPRLRGTGFNRRVKDLMLRRAFACGFRRVEFRVDARNERSQAAMAKLGAVREGVLRADRITWTGHVRDTVLFSILAEEWEAQAGGG
jgi:RimJ/RimL family protein N-acetyltransferase